MTARSESIQIDIDDEQMSGTFLSPKSKVPGVLFVHGWGGSQERDLERAKGIAGLGCVCLTFDLRGHTGGTGIPLSRVTREDNLRDLLAAYDRLLAHPALDTSAIAVVGTSYGGYLAAICAIIAAPWCAPMATGRCMPVRNLPGMCCWCSPRPMTTCPTRPS